jgi:hypothetical protein
LAAADAGCFVRTWLSLLFDYGYYCNSNITLSSSSNAQPSMAGRFPEIKNAKKEIDQKFPFWYVKVALWCHKSSLP